MSEYQNIVVIGGSVAGNEFANNIVAKLPGTHRILIIDALDFAFWPIAALRGAVVPGWEKRVTAPLRTTTIFPAESQHQVIAPNKVVELKANSVVLEHPFEGSNEVPFFKCIIATGSLQPSPMRPMAGSTETEYHETLKKHQREIKGAKKFVVIGGGTVGTEVAGEIRDIHPDVSITIVHARNRILNPSIKSPVLSTPQSYASPYNTPKLSDQTEAFLKQLKIDVVLGDKVITPTDPAVDDWSGSFGAQEGIKKLHLASGKTIEADYVFVSTGNKANSSLVEQADSGAVEKGKMVTVDDYLRVRSTNPASILTKNYYAIGDVSSTPGWKTSQGAISDAAAAAVNILCDVKGGTPKKYTRSVLHFIMVPLGATIGAGQITAPLVGTFAAPSFMVASAKARDLLCDMSFYSRFKGSEKVVSVPIPARA